MRCAGKCREKDQTNNACRHAPLGDMILGYIESLFPVIVGVPGIKIGLSNSVLMLSLYWLGIPFSFMLMLARWF